MRNAESRCSAAVAGLLALWTLMPTSANAQRLWSVGEATWAADGPAAVREGAAVVPRRGGPGGWALPRESAKVQVTYDYLRLGFGFLELPLPDGSVLEAENEFFEDRGGGNVTWSGAVPGAGYESVLFTLQDGHLFGWFGTLAGRAYAVHARPDGRGTLAVEAGLAGDWCGVEAGSRREARLLPDRPYAAVRPASVAAESNHDRLDILVPVSGEMEDFWRSVGGPAVGLQQLSDYLNMVFRNGALPATARLTPASWEPEGVNPPWIQGAHFESEPSARLWAFSFLHSAVVRGLQRRHGADLIHFFTRDSYAGGEADLRTTLDPGVLGSWSRPGGRIFAHEIGHTLGGGHDPPAAGDPSGYVRPYAFGHTDLMSCREEFGLLGCPCTVMSYCSEAYSADDPRITVTEVPFYSSVRHEPEGFRIGIAGERENERVFHETVPVAVRGSEAPGNRHEPHPRSVEAWWTERDTVRVTWPAASSVDSGVVILAAAEGSNDSYWFNDSGGASANVTPVLGAGGSVVGVDVEGLRPAGAYRVAVRGSSDSRRRRGLSASDSRWFNLERPGRSAGAPPPPGNLGADVTGPESVRLRWRDNSDSETGFEVWYRHWSYEWSAYGVEGLAVWRRYGERLPAGSRSVQVEGLLADEPYWASIATEQAHRGRYSFVVVAYNESGFSASETFHFEFLPGPHLAPTVVGEVPNCDLFFRYSGLELDGYEVRVCIETGEGARRRAWDYDLDSGGSGLLYFFDRDNVEILVKVLDGCAINGHRWVYVAPVTDLGFRLMIQEPGPVTGWEKYWHYDSERRSREAIDELVWLKDTVVGNPKGRTARTVSDTTAFPCTTAEIEAAKAVSAADGRVPAVGAADLGPTAWPAPLMTGAESGCVPSGPALTLAGGYRVSACWETENGDTGDAMDWGLDSDRMGLLYFSDRDLVDVLIKVRDDCAVGGDVSVSVAPATTAAFNLRVESPNGYVWTYANRLGETAEAVSDVSAFPCTGSPPDAVLCTGATCLLQGERFRVKAWYSKGGSRSRSARAVATALGASAGLFTADGAGAELLVRVVNRCRTSGWWEVHAGVASDANFNVAIRDTETNALKWFRPRGRSVVDAEAFACTEGDSGAMAGGAPPEPGAACRGATCLLQDRLFRVKSWYRGGNGSSRSAAAVPVDLGGSTGLFAFASGNPELLVRVADTCRTSGYWTVYAGAASDAGFSVAIRNTDTNELKWFRSRRGQAVADPAAFPCDGD